MLELNPQETAQREPAEHGMNPYARKALPFHGTPAYNAT